MVYVLFVVASGAGGDTLYSGSGRNCAERGARYYALGCWRM